MLSKRIRHVVVINAHLAHVVSLLCVVSITSRYIFPNIEYYLHVHISSVAIRTAPSLWLSRALSNTSQRGSKRDRALSDKCTQWNARLYGAAQHASSQREVKIPLSFQSCSRRFYNLWNEASSLVRSAFASPLRSFAKISALSVKVRQGWAPQR